MRLSLLLAAALAPPFSAAQDKAPAAPECENDSAKDGYCVKDCRQFQDAFGADGVSVIAEAVRTVQTCLIDKDLDARMGRDILAHLKSPKGGPRWTLECGLPGKGAGNEGADTDHEKRRILLFEVEAPAVFHELIHAADPPMSDQGDTYKYITVSDRHNSAFGNPDPVYGCELACFPEMIHEKRMYRGGNTHSAKDVRVPDSELESFAPLFPDDCGENGGDVCVGLEKYAYLCRAGRSLAWKQLPGVH